MNNSLKFLTSIAVIALSACSMIGQKHSIATLIDETPCYFPNLDREQAPKWVCTGQLENHITGIGIFEGSDSSYNLAFQIAQQRARADLARTLTVKVRSNNDDYTALTKSSNGDAIDARSKVVNQTEVNKILRGSRVFSSATDSNGTLYVLVGIDEKLAKSNPAKGIESSYNNNEVLHIKQEADEALSRLK